MLYVNPDNTGHGEGVRITDKLLASQMAEWNLVRKHYNELENVLVRSIHMDNGCIVKVQFNPSRMRSSAAKTDEISIVSRPCFLCLSNLPVQQQGIDFEKKYIILVNPYPIFRKHLTITLIKHSDQLIAGRFKDMLRLSRFLKDLTVFYNGPRCGASAPDHFHFQAGSRGFLPVEQEYKKFLQKQIAGHQNVTLSVMEKYYRYALVISGTDIDIISMFFGEIYNILQKVQGCDSEPLMNILTLYENGRWQVFIFPRSTHRPVQFFKKGSGRILISPASVDLGGVWITPRGEDYEKLDQASVKDIFSQVTLKSTEWEMLLRELPSAISRL
ncbi:MAG: DUF4922 domain-containing protein [Bacteroidales bacterium]